jgi:hypothetical protein
MHSPSTWSLLILVGFVAAATTMAQRRMRNEPPPIAYDNVLSPPRSAPETVPALAGIPGAIIAAAVAVLAVAALVVWSP